MAGNDPLIVPPPLVPGARVAVIAPSSPFDRALVMRGMGWLAERYRVTFDRDLFERHGLPRRLRRATPRRARRAAARSGARRSPRRSRRLRPRTHRAPGRLGGAAPAPKWLVGFSDATVLHVEALAAGVASLHAHNTAGLGVGDARRRERLRDALEAPRAARARFAVSNRGCPGRPRVPSSAAISPCSFTCLAAGRLRFPPGARARARGRDRAGVPRRSHAHGVSRLRSARSHRRRRRRRLHRLPAVARDHGAESPRGATAARSASRSPPACPSDTTSTTSRSSSACAHDSMRGAGTLETGSVAR